MAKNKLNPKISDKKAFKKNEGSCRICGEDDYSVLDVHRIQEGKDGGKYNFLNSVTLCSNCHRRIHDGKIEIIGKFLCSDGTYKIMIIDENGEEKFI